MGGGGGLRCNLKTTKKPHSARLNVCYGYAANTVFSGISACADTAIYGSCKAAASVGFHCKTHTSPLVATQINQRYIGKFAFGSVKFFQTKLAFTYNNLITKFQGVFQNVNFSLREVVKC